MAFAMPLIPITEPAATTGRMSRLEKTHHRLGAQIACLELAFSAIGRRPGVVAELGLGLGRTYDHLRRYWPERDIFVFDRVNKAFADCQPPPDRLLLGEIEETYPAFASRHVGRIVLANCDLGSTDREGNLAVIRLVETLVPPSLNSGAILMADLPIEPEGCEPLPLPEGAREGSYYLFRRL
jgi:hypothetical protein